MGGEAFGLVREGQVQVLKGKSQRSKVLYGGGWWCCQYIICLTAVQTHRCCRHEMTSGKKAAVCWRKKCASVCGFRERGPGAWSGVEKVMVMISIQVPSCGNEGFGCKGGMMSRRAPASSCQSASFIRTGFTPTLRTNCAAFISCPSWAQSAPPASASAAPPPAASSPLRQARQRGGMQASGDGSHQGMGQSNARSRPGSSLFSGSFSSFFSLYTTWRQAVTSCGRSMEPAASRQGKDLRSEAPTSAHAAAAPPPPPAGPTCVAAQEGRHLAAHPLQHRRHPGWRAAVLRQVALQPRNHAANRAALAVGPLLDAQP